ncbi:MAG: hypothetical protein AAFX39_05965 [Pseudomonadota bacterium]
MATDNIILEHLRAIRSKLDRLEDVQKELLEQFVNFRVREHTFNADDLVRDQKIMRLEDDVERIKRRLDLVD